MFKIYLFYSFNSVSTMAIVSFKKYKHILITTRMVHWKQLHRPHSHVLGMCISHGLTSHPTACKSCHSCQWGICNRWNSTQVGTSTLSDVKIMRFKWTLKCLARHKIEQHVPQNFDVGCTDCRMIHPFSWHHGVKSWFPKQGSNWYFLTK